MIFKDERTEAEKSTHAVLIGGLDTFMSGWGPVEGGTSYAYWACTGHDKSMVMAWVDSRDEIIRSELDTILGTEANESPEHCHIYVVRAGHRALLGADVDA